MLKKQFTQSEITGANSADQSNEIPLQKTLHNKTYFSPTQLDLFHELFPQKARSIESSIEESLPINYDKNKIQWATIIGPEFFTLDTNKTKSDRVFARLRTMDGKISLVPMIRGRLSPRANEYGILTVEHARILGALEYLWAQQGYRVTISENGSPESCICYVPIRELAALLGWGSYGGRDHAHLLNKIYDLKIRAYYLEFDKVDEYRLAGCANKGFSFLGNISLRDQKINTTGMYETVTRISFSPEYSSQLLLRRVVSRPLDFIHQRNQLAFLTRLYLEPILLTKRSGEQHAIELSNLIEYLWLPSAAWHRYKSQRKRQFEYVIKDLNGKRTTDDRGYSLTLEQGLNDDDFMLVGCLVSDRG